MRLRHPILPPVADRHLALDLAFGAGAAVVGALLRVPLAGTLGATVPFLTFYPALAVAAWAGGLRSGIAALVASVGLAILILGRAPTAVGDLVGTLIFIVAGLVIAWLGDGALRGRAAAEAARDRARFVADAARLLHEPLDREVTLDALTRIVVPTFADWCTIDLYDEDAGFTGAIIAAPDERQRAVALELRAAYPFGRDDRAGVGAVARTGQVEAVLEVPARFFDQIPDPRLRRLIESLGFRSFVSVPMTVPGGRTLGVLTVVRSTPNRAFDAEDVDVAADLGRRTAVALDHSEVLERARTRERQLDGVIAAIPEAVVLADAAGTVESANRAARDLLGDVVGMPIAAVVDGLRAVPGRDDVRATATGRYVVPRLLETDDGLGIRFLVLVDRTELVESEAARDAFVGMLSHELRTPITTIYGGAHLLRRSPTGEGREELADELVHETERLLWLVDDLLVLSRFEQGRLDAALEPLLPGRVIASAASAEARLRPSLRIEVQAAPDLPAILGDETYLRQVVRNLVANAAKYAGPSASLAIRVTAAGGVVRAEFQDDGPGIAPDDAERVFGLFERLPTRAGQPGAGIGLFVCRRLAEVMGGTLAVEAGEGRGARFVLQLPALDDDAAIDDDEPRSWGRSGSENGAGNGAAAARPAAGDGFRPATAAAGPGDG